jgi:tetratricopeptide (TPR) repeat protein
MSTISISKTDQLVVLLTGLVAAIGLSWGCAKPPEEASVPEETEQVGPILEGMGDFHHPISTENEMTQRLFDQGLVLAYGFNHLEAERSFREAARLDPDCAMCYWGVAFVRGPNINSMMDPESVPVAWEAMSKAEEMAPEASEKEQAYIEALSTRYIEDPPEDRTELDQQYADAMRELSQGYPDDLDAATLFAASLMDTTPWDYWEADGSPKEITNEIMATLEGVLAQEPDHPGAAHYYIHTVEKERPELAEAAADLLGDAAPGAGHLVHMPSHIYLRVGRYHDSTTANLDAVRADDSYITQCRKQGLYPIAYMPHNWHYIWYSASVEGRKQLALDAAKEMSARVDLENLREPGLGAVQHFWITPLYGYVRFGDWNEILAAPEPDEDLIYPRAVRHYARGMAFLRTDRIDEARSELEQLETLAMDPVLEQVTVWDLNTTAALVDIAVEVLSGEISAAEGDYDDAIDFLTTAVELEDELTYDEPPPWHQPVRQVLGAVLLEAGKPTEAEMVYREDLKSFPANGWSLLGLQQSLAAQGKSDEATDTAAQFETAWQFADVTLESSRF